jgi:hypothetical protein
MIGGFLAFCLVMAISLGRGSRSFIVDDVKKFVLNSSLPGNRFYVLNITQFTNLYNKVVLII